MPINEGNIQSLLNTVVVNLRHSPFTDVYTGKVGALPLLYEYGVHANNDAYTEIADYFMMDVLSGLNDKMPPGLRGLSGLGWMLNYLRIKKFVAVGEKAFRDITARITVHESVDWSIEHGFLGSCLYLCDRMDVLRTRKIQSGEVLKEMMDIQEKLCYIFQLLRKENSNFSEYYFLRPDTKLITLLKFINFEMLVRSLLKFTDKLFLLVRLSKSDFFRERVLEEMGGVMPNAEISIDAFIEMAGPEYAAQQDFFFHYAFHKAVYSVALVNEATGRSNARLIERTRDYILQFAEVQDKYIDGNTTNIRKAYLIYKTRNHLFPLQLPVLTNYAAWLQSYFTPASDLILAPDPRHTNLLGQNISLGMDGLSGLGMMCMEQQKLQPAKWHELFCI